MCPWRTAPSTYRSWSWRSRCVFLCLRRSVCVASVGWREHCLSLLPLRQTLVWLGHDAPKFSSLVLATPTRFDTLPATSALLGSGEGSSLAQRLGAQALSCLAAPPPNVKLTAPCAHTHSPENRHGGAGEQQPAVLVPAADGAATLPTSRCDTSHSSSQRTCTPRLLPRSTYCRCSQEGKDRAVEAIGRCGLFYSNSCGYVICPCVPPKCGRDCVCTRVCALPRGVAAAAAV